MYTVWFYKDEESDKCECINATIVNLCLVDVRLNRLSLHLMIPDLITQGLAK